MRASILTILLAGLASLATAEVGVTVWTGAGGNVRQGATIPIVVELRNDDGDRAGVVMAAFAQGTSPQTWAVQPLSLAPNARKRVFLYLPLNTFMAERVVVHYETASGALHAAYEEPVTLVPAMLPMLATVGEPPRGLPVPELDGTARYRAVIMQPELLPERCEGLEMYDAILMTPTPSLPVERAQVVALEDWVLRGGTLVVEASRRTDGLQQPELRALLPFLPDTTEQATLAGFGGPLDYAKGTIRLGKTLLAADGVPLIVRRNYGLGSIVCFAFNPSQPAFLSHSQHDALWRDVLGSLKLDAKPPEEWQGDFGAGTIDTVMRRVANTGGTPARLGLVVLLTALYALFVGPGDYFLLVKWLRRPRLTWITFPAMAIAFSVLAYGGARIWFGGETVSRGFRHVTVFPDEGKSIAFDAAGLFAGQSGLYALQHADGELWRQVQGQFDPEQNLIIDAEAALLRQRIPVWSHRVYVAGGTLTEYPDIQLVASAETVSIVNKSPHWLLDCTVYSGGLEGHCATVRPGETVPVPLIPKTDADPGESHDLYLGKVDPGYGNPQYIDAVFGRELFAGDALRRGATVLRAFGAGEQQSPLLVNGQRRSETIKYELAVVTYGSASE